MSLREVTTIEQADELLTSDQPSWLFKHSRICPSSSTALGQVQLYLVDHPEQTAGMVIVQTTRPVSNYIAEQTGITHQSPQLFLVKNQHVLWHTSHYGITAGAMADAYANKA